MPPQSHKVYLYFQCRNGWNCQFLEQDLQTPLPRRLHFSTPDKVIEVIQRVGGLIDSESKTMVNLAIENGRGGVFLKLTDEQYAKLKR
jgi:hypothetical protein